MDDENQIVAMTALTSPDRLLLGYDIEPHPPCNHGTVSSISDHMILVNNNTITLPVIW